MNRKAPTEYRRRAENPLVQRIAWLALAAILMSLFLVVPGLAQDDSPPRVVTDNEVNEVAKELYCPVCENIPLDVCPTQACHEWRELIREKLSLGWTKDQVKQYFADQYGDRVLGAPPARGLNWLAYTIPPLVILLGVFVLYRAFRTWRTPTQTIAANSVAQVSGSAAKESSEDDYIRRLEEELRKK